MTELGGSVLGEVRNYEDLANVLRARADELQLTRRDIDRLGNLPAGYASTLLAPRPTKHFGPESLAAILPALGVLLVVVEDPESLAQIAARRDPRDKPKPMASAAYHFKLSRRFLKRIGRKGGQARMTKMTRRERSRVSRMGARARWDTPEQATRNKRPKNGS